MRLRLPASRLKTSPSGLGPKRDGVWRESGLAERFPPGGPKVLWRVPVGTGYSGPAVANGRVYLMDRQRPTGPDGKPARPTRAGIPGRERVLCLDAADGKVLWKYEDDCPYKISYPSGPRTTPLVHQGSVYTLGAMGDPCRLDAATGVARWSKNLAKEYGVPPPVWGWAAHPLIDGDLLYCLVGGKGSAVVAFNKETGKEVWRALTSEEVGYSPPMIYRAGGVRQLIIWLSESINSLHPVTGRTYWTQAYPTSGPPQRPAVNIATVRSRIIASLSPPTTIKSPEREPLRSMPRNNPRRSTRSPQSAGRRGSRCSGSMRLTRKHSTPISAEGNYSHFSQRCAGFAGFSR